MFFEYAFSEANFLYYFKFFIVIQSKHILLVLIFFYKFNSLNDKFHILI